MLKAAGFVALIINCVFGAVEASVESFFKRLTDNHSQMSLAYAKMVGISTDVLIDDDRDLPEKRPSRSKHSSK